jgi:cytochrome oxidase assembly protein ShyY1
VTLTASRPRSTTKRDFTFLRQPRWIAFTLLIVVLMVAMLGASWWQLQRWDQRKAFNADVEARSAQPAVDVAELAPIDATADAVRDAEWRTVTATGTFDTSQQVFVGFRSFDGSPGYHVLTPLMLPDGGAVLINRGWVPVPRDPAEPPTAPAPPTAREVRVDGRLRAPQSRGSLGPRDRLDTVTRTTPRANVELIQQAVSEPLLPAYVEQIGEQLPDQPRLIAAPELDEGPHLSYAMQWAIFTVCAAAGWWLVVQRTAKERVRAASR